MFHVPIGGLSSNVFNLSSLDINNASISFLDVGEVDAITLNSVNINTSTLNISILNAGKVNATNVSLTNLSSNKISSNTVNTTTLNSTNINTDTLTSNIFNSNTIQTDELFSNEITVFGDITANNLTTANLTAGQNISILNNVITAVSTVPDDITLVGVSAQQTGGGFLYRKYLTLGGNGRPVEFTKSSNGDSFQILTQGGGAPDPDTHFILNRTGGAFNTSITGALTVTGNIFAPNFQPLLNFTFPLAKTQLNEVLVNNTNLVTAGSNFLVTSGAVHTAIQSATSASNSNIVQMKMFQGTTNDPQCDGGVTIVNLSMAPSANPQTAFHVDFTPKFQNSFINVQCNYSYNVTGNNADVINFELETVRNNNTAPLLIIDFVRQHWDSGGGGGTRSGCGGSQSGSYQNNDTLGKFHRIRLRVGNITGASNDTVSLNNTYAITVTVTEIIQALAQTNLSMTNLSALAITTSALNASQIRINDNLHPAELQGSSDNHAIVFRENVEGTAFREISYFRFLNGGVRASQTEKMRIQQNGNVGINTNTPTEKLDVDGNIRATGNISAQFMFCDLIVAQNLRTADLNVGTNISILNGSISAFLNVSNISVLNISARSIGSANNQPFFIKHGVISCLTVNTSNDVVISNNLKVLGDTEVLGDLSVDGTANFNVVNASNLSTATMTIGSGLSLANNTLSVGNFTGTDITCRDLIVDQNTSLNGTLKVQDIAFFRSDVNISDELYLGDPNVKSGRFVLYDVNVGNTMKMFYQNGLFITDIEATSINFTKDNISKIEISEDFNVFSDMNVFGKIIATDGIDLTNLSLINVDVLNASTLNISTQNVCVFNAITINSQTMNTSTSNACLINTPKINVSNLSVTLGTITNLTTTNTTVGNQLNVNKQTNSGKAIFNGLVEINNLATIQDVFATGTIFCDNDMGCNILDVTTTIGCNTLNATKVNVPNLSVTTKATIQNLSVNNAINASTIVANQIDIPKINVTNLSVTTKATIQNLSVNAGINTSTIVSNLMNAPKINVSNLSVTTKATIQNLSINNAINTSTLIANQIDIPKINGANMSISSVITCNTLRAVTLEGNTINASNISSKGDIIGQVVRGTQFVEGLNSFFNRLETDDLVLNNATTIPTVNSTKINVSNLSVNLSATIGGNLQLLGQVNGTLRASQNLSAQNVFAVQLVQAPTIDATSLLQAPLISGATIEGTTQVEAGINGINNGIVLLNGQASQTSTNQWVNVSNFRSTFTRSVATDPTNYIVRIGATDRMTIGNTSTRFNTPVIVDGLLTTSNASFATAFASTLNGIACTIPNFTAANISMTKINLSSLNAGGIEGRIECFSDQNSIVLRDKGLGNIVYSTPLEHRFFTDTAFTPLQRMVIRQNGNVGINTSAPAKLLDVNGNGIFRGNLEILNTNTVINALQVEEVNNTALTVAIRKARGTVGARTAVQTNDKILELAGQGFFGFEGIGGDYGAASASINMIAGQPFTPSAHGTFLSFSTTANNSVTLTEHLRLENNGNLQVVGNKNILSNRFRCLHLIDNLNNRFPNAGSGNAVNLVNPLALNGGRLHFDFQCGGFSNSATSVGYRFELRNSANNTTIDSTTCLFFFNQTGVHHFWSRTDVYTGVAAGSYILRVVRLNTNLIHDVNDFFNITMTEFPF